MLKLAIVNKRYSSWSFRPWILMRHFGIAFTEVVIPMGQEATRSEILRFSPSAKCPCLIDGDITVWDSLAIIEYLAETFPEHAIWPRERRARARARALSAEMHSGFMALRSQLPMNMGRSPKPIDLTPETIADIGRIEQAFAGTRQEFGAGGDFLFGEFSAADAMFAPVVSRFHTYAVNIAPPTRAYMDSMQALPAFKDWQAGADAEPWRLDKYEAI